MDYSVTNVTHLLSEYSLYRIIEASGGDLPFTVNTYFGDKYKKYLYYGKEVVNGRDPEEYRRRALERLPGHYKWGCFCAPEKCHGDILRSWLRLKLRLKRRYTKQK